MGITTPIASDVDLTFRPNNYFWASDIGLHLTSHIKGQERRRMHAAALTRSEYDLPPEVADQTLPHDLRESIGRIHPRYMGGEYLPDRAEGEVEIARIAIESTTQDVTCVYARLGASRIHYRVVDEYGGECLHGSAKRTSVRPLTLKQLLEFFLSSWDLHCCLEANDLLNPCDSGREALRFISDASSDFYDEFGVAVQALVQHWCGEVA